jgi:prepilin-type processing-associated H-X9-DG protein
MSSCLLCSLLVFGAAIVRADDPKAAAIAPFVDANVLAVGRLDLVKLDVDRLVHRLVPDQEHAGEISQAVSPWIGALRKTGAREIYVLLILPEILTPGASLPPVVVPLAQGAEAAAIGQLLCGGGATKPSVAWPTCATIHNAVFAGSNEALERIRRITAVARPELSAAWTTLGDTGAELLLIPSPESRRVIEEMLPNLPKELGGGPITTISQGLSWAAVGLNADPEPQVRMVLQGKDAAAAKTINELGKSLLQYLRQMPAGAPDAPSFGQLADDLKIEAGEDRITLALDAQKASKWATAMIAPVRGSATRTQCVNNLKQIALAMHIYHDRHNGFPPAYTVDKAGKPLLSWRVLILPYLEQEALYKEFHLDEPWDSPHNRALIERIPTVYRCPSVVSRRADTGKTTYLTPRGKSTIFAGPESTRISKVTDGTSNTILVVDAAGSHAVEWTKPDDWDVQAGLDLKVLFGNHPEGTNFAFADGSVHFLKDTIAPSILEKLLTKDGGEVVAADEY